VTCDGGDRCISSVCVPATGLLGWWSFEETGPQVPDVSGSNNHGSNELGRPVPGKVGMGLELSSNACVAIPDSPSVRLAGGRALTMMAWSNVTGCADGRSDHAIILNKEDTFELGVRCTIDGLTMREAIRTGPGWDWAGSAPLTAGSWQHLAVTWDGNRVRHYVDGVERDSHGQRGEIEGPSSGLGLGCRDVGSNGASANAKEWLAGTIDEVAIYGRALSAAELRTYYEATR
jgi:hypothetical protein